jgi:hypothetical protein
MTSATQSKRSPTPVNLRTKIAQLRSQRCGGGGCRRPDYRRAGPPGSAGQQRLGGYERLAAGAWEEWNSPLWVQPLVLFDAMFTGGVRTHYVALARCTPLLMATPGSLVVTGSRG